MSKAQQLAERKLKLREDLKALDEAIALEKKKSSEKIGDLFLKADAVEAIEDNPALIAGAIQMVLDAAEDAGIKKQLETAAEKAKFFRPKPKKNGAGEETKADLAAVAS